MPKTRKSSRSHRRRHYRGGNANGSGNSTESTLGDVGGAQGYVLGQVGNSNSQYTNTETNNLPIGNALVGLNGQSVAKIMSGGRRRRGSRRSRRSMSLAGGKRRRGSRRSRRSMSLAGGRHRKSHRVRGGMPYGGALSPSSFDGSGVGTSGVGLQLLAGNAN